MKRAHGNITDNAAYGNPHANGITGNAASGNPHNSNSSSGSGGGVSKNNSSNSSNTAPTFGGGGGGGGGGTRAGGSAPPPCAVAATGDEGGKLYSGYAAVGPTQPTAKDNAGQATPNVVAYDYTDMPPLVPKQSKGVHDTQSKAANGRQQQGGGGKAAAGARSITHGAAHYDSAPSPSPPRADRGLQPAVLQALYGGAGSLLNTAGAPPRSDAERGKGEESDRTGSRGQDNASGGRGQ